MASQATVTSNGPLPAAVDMTAALRERSQEIENARRLPADISRQFAEAGFYRMLVPREYGGLEVHPVTFVRTLETLAIADASASWNVMVAATTGTLAASLPPETAKEVWQDDPSAMAVGVTAPMGRATIEGEGYRVNGRWPWGSGGQNAQWILGGCLVMDADGPRMLNEKAPAIHLMLFKREQVEILDNWYVSGLRGSGSNDFQVTDALVPARRTTVLGAGKRIVRTPLTAFPMFGILALGVTAAALGCARRAIDELVELAWGKTPMGSLQPLANKPRVQTAVAEAEAKLRAARAFIFETIDAAWAAAESGERLSVEHKQMLRLAAAHATTAATEVVDAMYNAGGGTSVYEASPLQRCFRDVHTATQHVMVGPAIFETIGRLFLGLETNTMLL